MSKLSTNTEYRIALLRIKPMKVFSGKLAALTHGAVMEKKRGLMMCEGNIHAYNHHCFVIHSEFSRGKTASNPVWSTKTLSSEGNDTEAVKGERRGGKAAEKKGAGLLAN